MPVLGVEEIHVHYGPRSIFDGATLAISPRDRVGLVGPNGAGKSTLMRILAGLLQPDAGRAFRARGIRVGYLAQEHVSLGDGTLLESTLAAAPGRDLLEERLFEVERALGCAEDPAEQLALAEELSNLHHELAGIERQFAVHQAQSILAGLGFLERDHRRPIRELSGGWRMRAALAALLFQRPDVLLLDEPTNHLDVPSVAWLSSFLASFGHALILTCHDRAFLNRHVTRIASLELEGLRTFPGNYDDYLEQRELELDHLAARIRRDDQRRKELESFVERFRAKATKSRQAQSKAKLIEKMQERQVELPKARRPVSIVFPPVERAGEVAVSVRGLSYGYDEVTLFDRLDLSVRRGDRIAVVGVNGAGKSTLLRLIAGELRPRSGEVAVGHAVRTSYFAQHQTEVLDPERTVLEEVWRAAPAVGQTGVRTLLGAFLFSDDEDEKPIRVLSGGEKTRVALARMLALPGNLLLLDEPTNHLDTESADKLTASLETYDGTLLFVSHNLDFARRLSNKVWDVHDGIVDTHPGSIDDYLERLARGWGQEDVPGEPSSREEDADERAAQKEARKRHREAQKERDRKRASLEKSMRELEARIAKLEAERAALEERLAAPETHARIEDSRTASAHHEAIGRELDHAIEHWTELGSELEGIER